MSEQPDYKGDCFLIELDDMQTEYIASGFGRAGLIEAMRLQCESDKAGAAERGMVSDIDYEERLLAARLKILEGRTEPGMYLCDPPVDTELWQPYLLILR